MSSSLVRSLIVAFAAVLAVPALALGSWSSTGSDDGYAKADAIAAGNTPTATVSNRNVTINWTATGGSAPATGYIVKRFSTGGAEQTIGASCSGTIAATSCTETSVPPGTWRYSVTPARQNWRGDQSSQSTVVTVNGPALTLSPSNVSSLPQVLTGQLTNFVPGQTVAFRLDNQASGELLTGSITPTPVAANGTANVSVTLPSGTSNGPHTIYAVGSGSDVASAAVTVALPTTITTSAYDWRDASAGAAEANASQFLAFANDSPRIVTTGAWASAFSASRYVDVNLNSPLRAGSNITSGTINLRLASNTTTNACFYIEVRKASDNALISTSGSGTSPFCTTAGSTQTNFSVPVSGVSSGAAANDLRLRIFGRTNTAGGTWTLDQATLTVTGDDGNFTLYPNSYSDAADGSAAAFPWALASDDNTLFTNSTSWQAAYAPGRYLKATFPGYVPAGATVQSATLTHVYRSSTAARPVCSYVEILDGTTVIGTHGNAGSDLSCAATTTDVADTISLPEVNTVAEANSLSAKIYGRRTGAVTTSSHDQVRLSITYVK